MAIYGKIIETHSVEIDTGSNDGSANNANLWLKVAEADAQSSDKASAVIGIDLDGRNEDFRAQAVVYLQHGDVHASRYDIAVDIIKSSETVNPFSASDFTLTYSTALAKSQLWVRSQQKYMKCYATIIQGSRMPNDNYTTGYQLTVGSSWAASITSLGAEQVATLTDREFNDLAVSGNLQAGNLTSAGDLNINGGDILYGNAQNATIDIADTAHNAAGKALTITAGSPTAGTTDNIAGGSITIKAGAGKGEGAGGDIVFQTANAAGSAASTINAHATALTISDDLSSTFAGDITVNGDTATFTSANSNDPLVVIKNTTNDATAARLQFVKDKGAAGADGDDIGTIKFTADNSAQEQTDFAKILAEVRESTDTDEAGKLTFWAAASDGTTSALVEGMEIRGSTATAGKVDVDLGAHATSLVTLAGNLRVGGNVIQASDGGSTITMDTSDNVTISNDLTVGGGDIYGATDGGLNLRADTHMKFYIDNDGGESSKEFQWYDDDTERMVLDQSGNLQIDGDLTVSGGNITNAITCDSTLTVASDLTTSKWKLSDYGAHGNNFASLIHKDLHASVSSDYAMLQRNTGMTYVNSKSGQPIKFRTGNSEASTNEMTFQTGGLTVGTSVTVGSSQLTNAKLKSTTNLNLHADGNMYLDIDDDGNSNDNFFAFRHNDDNIMVLDEHGNLQINGDLTISGGNITNSITCDSDLTVNGTISGTFDGLTPNQNALKVKVGGATGSTFYPILFTNDTTPDGGYENVYGDADNQCSLNPFTGEIRAKIFEPGTNSYIRNEAGYLMVQSHTGLYLDFDVDNNGFDGLYIRHNALIGGTQLARFESDGDLIITGNYTPFTGTHISPIASELKDKFTELGLGMIVSSTGVPKAEHSGEVSNSYIGCVLTSKAKDKKVYGVVSKIPYLPKSYMSEPMEGWGDEEYAIKVNSVGEGRVWVTNISGDIENGDYITSSDIEGYGQLQDDDLLHNYTVAKCTEDIDWSRVYKSVEHNGNTYRKYLAACTYHCG